MPTKGIDSLSCQYQREVRAYWAIENTLHWTLDVVFNEDKSRVRKDHAPQNIAIIQHVALNVLNQAKKHQHQGATQKSRLGVCYSSNNFGSGFLMG